MTTKTLSAAIAAAVLQMSPLCHISYATTRADAFNPSAWEVSSWISAADAPVVTGKVKDGTRAADGSSWFVSTPRNAKKVVSARWMTTALGVYELYVNGVKVGEEVLKPGYTHYEKTRLSFTYDITDLFHKGNRDLNLLAAQVTPGWWADKIVTPAGNEGMYGKKCAFRGVLELVYSDGSRQLLGTDTVNWKAGVAGPVKHAAIYDGEIYDAREVPGYDSPEKLSAPELNDEFKGEILPSSGAEIYFREDLALSPVRAYVWEGVEGASDEAFGKVVIKREYKDGDEITVCPGDTLVVDFGQNCAAVPSFLFRAASGTELTCLPSEILNDGNGSFQRKMDGPEGSTHRKNLRVAGSCMRLEYIFKGFEGLEEFRPECTFFGYRYVSIYVTDTVRIARIRSIPVSSISGKMETGFLKTGNELVNKLISNTIWSMRSNYLSVPTDCPQRNERLGWTADTQVFAETGSFFADTRAFFHKWMRDMRDTQSPEGAFPGVAPWGQYGATPDNMMRIGWADAGVIVPWTVWKQFGDNEIIEECWESMKRYMDHVASTKYDHTALKKENGNFQWADWLSYEPLESCGGSIYYRNEDGKRITKPEAVEYWNYLGASYWAIDAAMMRDMAAATGRDTTEYADMTREAVRYIRDRFLTPEGGFRTAILDSMQTPALFAIRTGAAEGCVREKMKARLRENFAAHGNRLQTGFLGTSILMETLSENGMTDIAYELLFQRRNPSWLYSVDNGATTIWERWNSYMIEKGMGPRGMNSFNHYAYGVVCSWLWERAAGIMTDKENPGFRHLELAPVPDRRLGFVDASYRSASGMIRSSWRYEGDRWIWDFTIPEGVCATVTVPGKGPEGYAAGSYTVDIQAAVTESRRSDGIKVRFLGTGAADWKNRVTGTERRRLTSILVDDAVLVDYTASDRDMLPPAVTPKAILYTHSHSDHFDAAAAIGTGVEKVYVGRTWLEYAGEAFAKASSESGQAAPEIVPLDVFSNVEVGGICFTALPANHSTSLQGEQTIIYLLEKNGTRLLYATDTGGIPAAAARAAGLDAHSAGSPIHGLIMEATMSDDEDFRIFTHSSVGTVLRTADVLSKTGRYTPAPGQRVYLTHLARTLHGTQQELDASLPAPLKAACDGLEVIFSRPL